MSVEEIINSGLLESYVLGNAGSKDIAMIEALCKSNPELIVEIEKIEASLISASESLAPELNSEIKNNILADINKQSAPPPELKLVMPETFGRQSIKLYRIGMAASLLLFVTSLVYIFYLQQQVGKLNSEIGELLATKSYLAQEIKIQQAAYTSMHQQLDLVTDPGTKSIALKGMNTLDGKNAIVYWNSANNEVYFRAANLPQTPADKQYQLWAIVDGKPVDMGVINLEQTQVFQKMKTVKGAQAFAVTLEKSGGSPTPNLPGMCLLGNV